jgi:hypothetical protein
MECMRVTWTEMKGHTEVAPGVKIWTGATGVLENYKGYDVTAEVELSEAGKMEVAKLSVAQRPGGPPVTGEALRTITVQSIIRDSVAASLQTGKNWPAGQEISANGLLTTEEALRLKAAGPVAETLEWVGRVYRLSEIIGHPPTKAVEETFQISRSTAGAWIGRARAAGHIAPVGDNA